MCEECRNEEDDNYQGDSIAEKRRKAIRSIVRRHPELGIEPEDITLRFTPKTEKNCIRVNITSPEDVPTYEIHIQASMGNAMSSSPPIGAIAKVAWIASNRSFSDICDILSIHSTLRYDALFVSGNPPIEVLKAETGAGVHEYERSIQENLITDLDD